MNKNKFTEFFKGKGYYVLLFVGVMAIAAVAIIGSDLSSKENQEEQNYVDLNDTENNVAADDGETELAENNPVAEGIVNSGDNSNNETATNEDPGQELATGPELEGYENTDTSNEDAQAAGQTEEANAEGQPQEVAEVDQEATDATAEVAVETGSASLENLAFQADEGLLWPVSGNVVMNYSMDHTIYFATLMQYKCNPAIIIDAEVGTEVKAATDGIVTSIDANNDETGFTVTLTIGDGYSLVYGQLDKDSVSLEVGDTVDEGDVIATIAQPTRYYSVEGSNLYFQVMENDETRDPMLFLRDAGE